MKKRIMGIMLFMIIMVMTGCQNQSNPLEEAQTALKDKDYAKVMNLVEALEEPNDINVPLLDLKQKALMGLGDYKQEAEVVDLLLSSQEGILSDDERSYYTYRKAQTLVAFEDYKAAWPLFDGLKTNSGYEAMGLSGLAKLSYFEGDYEKAMQMLDLSLSYNPNLADTYAIMGAITAEEGESVKAIEYLTQALLLDDTHTLALQHRGMIYYDYSVYDFASRDLEK